MDAGYAYVFVGAKVFHYSLAYIWKHDRKTNEHAVTLSSGTAKQYFAGGIVANLQAHGEVYEVEVQVVQLEILQGLVQAHMDVLWCMMGKPQLCRRDDRR